MATSIQEGSFSMHFVEMPRVECVDARIDAVNVLNSFCKDPEISINSLSLFNIKLLKLFYVLYTYCVDKKAQMSLDLETLDREYIQKAEAIIDLIQGFLGDNLLAREVDLDCMRVDVEFLLRHGEDPSSFRQRPYFLRDFQCALRQLISLVREHLICFSRAYTDSVRVAVLNVLALEPVPLDNAN